jgi:hypothetical protein
MTNIVPLSVMGTQPAQYAGGIVAVGNNRLTQQLTNDQGYWFVVLDASNLAVVYNAVQQSGSTVPNFGVSGPGYLLVVVTLGVTFDNQPQGALFKFLVNNGAGAGLLAIEQLASQIGCGSIGGFCYTFVTTLNDPNPGFEAYDTPVQTGYTAIQTLSLLAVNQPGGGTAYTPIALR